MINDKDLLMNWDDSIETDGQEYILLPEGEYNFKVTNFERGRFNGSAKIPQCNKATITIQIEAKEGTTSVKFDLILYRTLEWRISAFFRCIGQKKHGEKLTMDWGKVIGSKGRAYIKQRSYTNLNGEEKFINDVERFIDYNEDFFDDLPF
ncbi:MAG: hypothetical protein RBQ91_06935 [Acholeplasma sp.]|nr:hypothetical protein [Acholeplasma sp.]